MTARNERRTQRSICGTVLLRVVLLALLVPLLFGLDFVARWRWQSICDVQAPGGSQIWWTEASGNPLANSPDVLSCEEPPCEAVKEARRRCGLLASRTNFPRFVVSPDEAWVAMGDSEAISRLRRTNAPACCMSRSVWPGTRRTPMFQRLAVSQNGRYLFIQGGDPRRLAILDAPDSVHDPRRPYAQLPTLPIPSILWSHQIMAGQRPGHRHVVAVVRI